MSVEILERRGAVVMRSESSIYEVGERGVADNQ